MFQTILAIAIIALGIYVKYIRRNDSSSNDSLFGNFKGFDNNDTGMKSPAESMNEVERMLMKSGTQYNKKKMTIIKNGETIIKEQEYTSGMQDTYSENIDYELMERAKKDVEMYLSSLDKHSLQRLKGICTESVIDSAKKKIDKDELNNCNEHYMLNRIVNCDMGSGTSNDSFISKNVQVYVELYNYTTDVYSRKIISGSDKVCVNAEINIVYRRKIEDAVDSMMSNNEKVCSQCGAPIEGNELNCKYCGAYLKNGEYKIYDIKLKYI